MAAAGKQAEEALHKTMEEYNGQYLMLVEGSIPTEDEAYCCIGGRSALSLVKEAAEGAKAIIAWGNCASAGCIQAANPNPTGAKPVHKVIKGKPIINVRVVPDCQSYGRVIVHLLLSVDPAARRTQNWPAAFIPRVCLLPSSNYDAGFCPDVG
jgi:hydrogenase small subunit